MAIVLLVLNLLSPYMAFAHDQKSMHDIATAAFVKVLDAPMLEEPRDDARVLQWAKRGAHVWLHNSWKERPEMRGPHSPQILSNDTLSEYRAHPKDRFVLTTTKMGRPAWMYKHHVFIFTEDDRELRARRFLHDDTDYRIPEPLPQGYPFHKKLYPGKTQLALHIIPYRTGEYPFATRVKNQKYRPGYELSLAHSFEWTERYRWELGMAINYAARNFENDQFNGREQDAEILFFPGIEYLAWSEGDWAIAPYGRAHAAIFSEKKVLARNTLTSQKAKFRRRGVSAELGVRSYVTGKKTQFFMQGSIRADLYRFLEVSDSNRGGADRLEAWSNREQTELRRRRIEFVFGLGYSF